MATLSLSERIDAPLDRVFALASDLPRAAQHIDGIDKIEMLTESPVGVGTKWKETRTMFGKQATEVMEVTAFNPPSAEGGPASYRVEADSCGCHFLTTFSFTPEGDATVVTLDLATQAQSLMAKMMTPLSGRMIGSCKKAMEQDLTDLKRAAEGNT